MKVRNLLLILAVALVLACSEKETHHPDNVVWYLDGFPTKEYGLGDTLSFEVLVEAKDPIQFVDINLSLDRENQSPIVPELYFESASPGKKEVLIKVEWKLGEEVFSTVGVSNTVFIVLLAKTKHIETRESTYFTIVN